MDIKTQPKLLRRSLSTLIDYGIYMIFFIWLVTTYGVSDGRGGYTLENDLKAWWVIIFWFLYFPVIESIRGQTLGKLILGMRVITASGNPISFGQAFKRHLVDMIDFFFFGVVALVIINNSSKHQRLGDIIAKTIVIGGESSTCLNCKESLTLTPNEIVNGEFKCPICNMANAIQ